MNEDQKSAALPVNEEKLDPVAISILTSLNDAGPARPSHPRSRTCIRGNAPSKQRPAGYLAALPECCPSASQTFGAHGPHRILRKGKPVDPNDFKGVYRLRLKADVQSERGAGQRRRRHTWRRSP